MQDDPLLDRKRFPPYDRLAVDVRQPGRAEILRWEMLGVGFIILLGSFLHFVFDLLGRWPPAALVAAVNESVWEHLKLAFWPALLYALLEWPFFRRRVPHFWPAKAAGICIMPAIVVAGFYGYTALAGRHIFWIDISLFVIAAFAGQRISAALLLRDSFAPAVRIAAGALLVLMIAAFSLGTYFPPSLPLFRESRTGQLGIPK